MDFVGHLDAIAFDESLPYREAGLSCWHPLHWHPIDKTPDRQVYLDRIARLRQVPSAFDKEKTAPGGCGQALPVLSIGNVIICSVDNQDRTLGCHRSLGSASYSTLLGVLGCDQSFWVGLQCPADGILALLGGMWL